MSTQEINANNNTPTTYSDSINLYPLTESIMNGTVTMSINVSAVEAKTFEEAVDILTGLLEETQGRYTHKNKTHVTFTIPSNPEQIFSVYGELKNKPMEIIRKVS